MTPKKIPFPYDINRMEAVDLVSIIHIDDYDTRFLELILSNEGSPLNVDGCTVAARFVTAREKYLLSDNVPCVAESNTITIPIDAAAVDDMACDIKIEVNIVDGEKILTLPFPLWIRVRGSILDDAQVTPESEGTIPDLLKAAQQALDAAKAAIEAASDYENMDNKPQINGVELVGNKTSAQLGLQKELTAGENVTINENGVISASGGVTDYNELSNKPSINGVTLGGNKTADDLILQPKLFVDNDLGALRLNDIYGGLQSLTLDGPSSFIRFNLQNTYMLQSGFDVVDITNRAHTLFSRGEIPVDEMGMYYRYISYVSSPTAGMYYAYYFTFESARLFRQSCNNRVLSEWQEITLGSRIVSGVVNQNGTITFTDSDGNTFTTTGASVIGPQGPQGATGPQGPKGDTGATGPQGPQGDDYILTNQDKTDIANLVLQLLPNADTMLFPEVSEVNNG